MGWAVGTGVHAQQPAPSVQGIGCGAGEARCPELQPHLSGPAQPQGVYVS